MTGFLHVFRWDRAAVAVPPRGNPHGVKYRVGAWKCVMCQALLIMITEWNMDHAGDCPGWVAPANGHLDERSQATAELAISQ